MKQLLHGIDYLLWVTVIAAEIALFIGVLRRKLAADFPHFVWLLGFIVFKSLLLFAINFLAGFWVFYYAFYAGIAIESTLLVLVAAEIFRLLFEPASALKPEALSRMTGALITTVALLVAFLWHPHNEEILISPFMYRGRTAIEAVSCLSF